MWRYFAELKEWLPYERLPFFHFPNRSGTYYGAEIRTNSEGFRDNEYARGKPPGKMRIAMIGDSFVLGWGVPFEDTMAKVLERELNAPGDRFEVINMGVGNYDSVMELELFKLKGLAFRPDIVLLVYFVNDPEPPQRISQLGYYVKRSSYLGAFFFDRYMKFRARLDKDFNWKDYYASLYTEGTPDLIASQDAIRELARLCRDEGIQLFIVSYPELHELNPYPLPMATDHIRNLAQESEVPFLDLLPAFAPEEPSSLWVSMEDTHGNVKASRLAAHAMYEALQSSGLMNR
jgi:lysophospholipase L1-like esterase